MTNAYRYDASKGRFSGVPARDLTAEDIDRLGPRERRIVRLADAYTEVKPKGKETAKAPDADGGKETK